MAFDKKEYDKSYHQKKYDMISFPVAKGKKSTLKEFASLQDKSVSALILEALWKCYKLDLKTPADRPEE